MSDTDIKLGQYLVFKFLCQYKKKSVSVFTLTTNGQYCSRNKIVKYSEVNCDLNNIQLLCYIVVTLGLTRTSCCTMK